MSLCLSAPRVLSLSCPLHAPDIHVNIDDCWQLTNRTLPWDNPKGRQIANPTRFPHGMKALADYIHDKGLKFGVCKCTRNLPLRLGLCVCFDEF